MTEPKYSIGDPVWSRMRGYCPWPSRIAAPSESSLKNTADKLKDAKPSYLVYFFGSNNFAWMSEDTIKPYDEFKDKNKNGSKTAKFKQGLKQIEEYIERGGKATLAELIAESAQAANSKNNTNNDYAKSPSAVDDSPSHDLSNLPTIDEEIATMHSKKPSATSKNSITSPTSVQKDYSRTPFKSKKRPDDLEVQASGNKRVRTSDDDYDEPTSPAVLSSSSSSYPKPPTTNKSGVRNFLLRAPQYDTVLDTPIVNMESISSKLKSIRPSKLKFGFIGVGFMGQRLLKNLLNSGHEVSIWNRTSFKCKSFEDAGAYAAKTPADVVTASDIVISCLADPHASKEIVFGPFGILAEMNSDKGYVEMSSIDPETSNDISEAIIARGGRYLEAPMIANGKSAAEAGELTIVAAGDRSLYEDCSSCFQAMGKQSFFLGHQAGHATKMNLIMSMLYGTMLGALTECCALVELADLQFKEFKEILKLSMMNCPLLHSAIDRIRDTKKTALEMPIGHMQKDLKLSLNLAEEYTLSCPITAVTNEVYKGAKRQGAAEMDAVAALFNRNRY